MGQSEPERNLTEFGQSAQTPYLFTDSNNTLYLTWTEVHGKENQLKFAAYSSDGWSSEKIIASGKDWFINWADYPVVASSDGKNLMAHYLKKKDSGTYNYDIHLVYSTNSGSTWNSAGVLHDDQMAAEHGFVSMIPYEENFLLAWLDGRNTRDSIDIPGENAMTLRASIVSPEGRKLKEWEVDNRVCDCCQTSLAITSDGPLVVYRNRSKDEVRDMFSARLVKDSWTVPSAVNTDNWMINGCPVNGPRIVSMNHQVAVAWFTAANKTPMVNLAFSSDGGATFEPPIQLSQTKPIGRVDLVWLNSQEVFMIWMENDNIVGARISVAGDILRRYIITSTDGSRGSGFPQLAMRQDKLFIAWTSLENNTIQIQSFRP